MNVKSATRFFLVLLLLAAIFPVMASAAPIIASDGELDDRFGSSVAIFDNFAVVGAPGNNNDTGSAYVFQYGTSWIQQAKLPRDAVGAVPSNYYSTTDNFGSAVAISGSYILVGAPRDDQILSSTTTLSDVGSAYFFRWDGTYWNFVSRLRANDPEPINFFGTSVDMSDQYMIAGAPGRKTDTGAVYIFPMADTGAASQITEDPLSALDGAYHDRFGSAVSISGNYAAVGAPGDDDNISATEDHSGSVYIFERSGDVWSQAHKLHADTPESGDSFGEAVAISGYDLIVGATGAGTNGEAYIFQYDNGEWVFQQMVSGLDTGFGHAVAISGDYAIVSSDNSSYVFKRGTNGWTQSPTVGTGYSADVGISGYFAISGEPTDSSNTGMAVIEEVADLASGALSLPPTIQGLPSDEVQVRVGGTEKTFTFQVYDAETAEGSLTVTPTISDDTLGTVAVTDPVGGLDSTRILTITSKTKIDTGIVTVKVTDQDDPQNTTSVSFPLNINDPPTITPIEDQSMPERTDSSDPGTVVTFTASDKTTEAGNLDITINSSNTSLVPAIGLRLTQNATDLTKYTLEVKPALDKSGTSIISIDVEDEDLNVSTESFTLTVNGVPKITGLPESESVEQVSSITPYSYFLDIWDPYTPDGGSLSMVEVGKSITGTTATDADAVTVSITQTASTTWRLDVNVKANKVTVDPLAITVTATDTQGVFSSETMLFQVGLSNAPSIVFPQEGQTITLNEGNKFVPIEFTVSDADSAYDDFSGENGMLSVGLDPDRPLISAMDGRVTIQCDGKGLTGSHNCTLTITDPSPPQHIETTIYIRATDYHSPTADAYTDFSFIYNTAPDIEPSPLPNVEMDEDPDQPAVVDFIISDGVGETPLSTLINNVNVTAEPYPAGAPLVVNSPISYICNSDGTCSFQLDPLDNAFGKATITVSVTDGDGNTTNSSFRLSVAPVNDLPEIIFTAPTPISFLEDTSETINFQVKDVDGDNLYVEVILGDPNAGTTANTDLITYGYQGLNIISDGTKDGLDHWVYDITSAEPTEDLALQVTPNKNANSGLYGEAAITLSVDDKSGIAQTYTFTVYVDPDPDEPVITLPSPATVSTLEDTQVIVPITISDPDQENVTLTADASASAAMFESVVFQSTGTNQITAVPPLGQGLTAQLVIDPKLNQNGTASITFTATDAAGLKAEQKTLTVNITPVNDFPTISPIQDTSTPEDQEKKVYFTVGDIETSPDKLTVGAIWGEPDATIAGTIESAGIMQGPDAAGKVTLLLSPPLNQHGYADITVTVLDPQMIQEGNPPVTEIFRLTVNSVNDQPVLANLPQTVETLEDTPVTVEFNATDVETSPENLILTATWGETQMAKGTWSFTGPDAATGKVAMTITPAPDAYGSVPVTITVTDVPEAGEQVLSDEGSFTLYVTGVNDRPEIEPDGPLAIESDEDIFISPEFTVSDPDTLAENIEVKVIENTNESLFPNPTVSCTIEGNYFKRCNMNVTPAHNLSGVGSITVRSNDFQLENGTDTLTFDITVVPVNDVPTFTLLDEDTFPIEIIEDQSRVVYYRADDPDEGDTATVEAGWVWTNPSTHTEKGTIVKGTDSRTYLEITPPPNLTGEAKITVSVTDGEETLYDSFLVKIVEINDAPTLSLDYDETGTSLIEDDPFEFSYTISDQETDTDLLDVGMVLWWKAKGSSDSDFKRMTGNYFQTLGTGDTRNVTFTPPADLAGTAKIEVTVRDQVPPNADNPPTAQQQPISVTKTILLSYESFDDPPTVTRIDPTTDPITMEEDGPAIEVTFEVSDVDSELQNIGIRAVETTDPGIFTDLYEQLYFDSQTAKQRKLTIDPPLNAYGVTNIEVTVYDKNDETKSSTIQFTLRVIGVNDLPTISAVMQDGQPIVPPVVADEDPDDATLQDVLTLSVDVNDPDGDTLIMGYDWVPQTTSDIGGVKGTIVFDEITAEGNVTFTMVPDTNDFGEAQITIKVKDSVDAAFVETAPFTLRIRPVNDLPTINLPIPGDPDIVYVPELDSTSVKFGVADIEDSVNLLTVYVQSDNVDLLPPYEPYVTVNRLTSPEANLTHEVILSPNAIPSDGSNEATVTIIVQDTDAGEQPASFKLVVTPLNVSRPSIQDIAAQVMNEDGVLTISFTASDRYSNVEIQSSSSAPDVIPEQGVTINKLGEDQFEVVIEPAANVPLTDSTAESTITLRAINESQGTNETSFTVTVKQVNDAPKLLNLPQFRTIPKQQSETIYFTVEDVETPLDALEITAVSSNAGAIPVTQPVLATETGDNTHKLTIGPTAGESGVKALITVVVDDGSGIPATNTDTATIEVTVGQLATGDLDGDGQLGLGDVITVLQVLAGLDVVDAYVEAEPSGNNKIDMVDALMLLQHVSGLRTIQ